MKFEIKRNGGEHLYTCVDLRIVSVHAIIYPARMTFSRFSIAKTNEDYYAHTSNVNQAARLRSIDTKP